MEPIRPGVDWELDRSWLWPAWKFGLEPDDLFHALHYQHNTVEIPLQDFTAFLYDVRELAGEASSRDELDRLLAERKQQRTKELLQAFRDAAIQVTGRPQLLPDGMWVPSVRMFRTRSLASLVMLFAGFVPDHIVGELNERREEMAKQEAMKRDKPDDVRGDAKEPRCPNASPSQEPSVLPSQPPPKPSEQESKPSKQESKPSKQESKPSKQESKPSKQESKPSKQESSKQPDRGSKRGRVEATASDETAEPRPNSPNKRRRTADVPPSLSR
ncbi:hypothetical protein CDV31_014065 [Fusarium ambrosium]|uniref:Uncharacterized protein n=1 Tax=Fusarium ambrosium TaxID=131363 RepID=A0A428SZ24_9HYPO|nr:hypothetical protein CDV31_014065 [Fusarium ambrosium]